ncbi:MAG: hypothetical protein HYZ47_02575 [Simkania negevensis]|nr:hypothetical protein [Simkania negevensis]
MKSRKKELSQLLDQIGSYQKRITETRSYYHTLVNEIEAATKNQNNPGDDQQLHKELETLGKEFEEKNDLLSSQLNEDLLKGLKYAEEIGLKVFHDYKIFWEYMTKPIKEEVKLDHVLRDIDHLKKDLASAL